MKIRGPQRISEELILIKVEFKKHVDETKSSYGNEVPFWMYTSMFN